MGLVMALMVIIIISFKAGYDVRQNEEPMKYQLYQFFDWEIDSEEQLFTPKDRIKESQITVGEDYVLLKIDNPIWSSYENTHSMLPTLSEGHNGLYVKPEGDWDLQVGDIVAYESGKEIIVHRIVNIEQNADGELTFTLKGDNNPVVDPEKIKYEQIQRVLIGMLY